MKKTGTVLAHLLAIVLTAVSLQASGATKTVASDFNHSTTGFALTGGHASAACETCHVGGVFKGTPRNCDGCHAQGKRVVATPKSTSHIVTDAPCETCHFNASTWLGARFNHGTAKPGQCATCHNGRLSLTKPPSHNSGSKATESCDKCHRTYAWLPATWNHTGVGSCDGAGCHLQGSNPYYRSGATHSTTGMGTYACGDCHSYFAWSPARYKHNTGATCSSCHTGGAIVKPENRKPTTSHFFTTECNTCHTTATWLGASYHSGNVAGVCGTCHNGTNGVKGTVNDPNGIHIPLTLGGNPNCDLCHTSTTTFTAYRMNHSGQTTCNGCHASTSTYVVATKRTIGNHQGSTAGQDCSACHASTSTWAGALGAKPSNHIPYNAGVACSSCHSSAMSGPALHTYLSTFACTTCHLRNNPYVAWGQDTKSIGHEGWSTGDCSQSGCHRPAGNEGSSYINWN